MLTGNPFLFPPGLGFFGGAKKRERMRERDWKSTYKSEEKKDA